MRYLLERRREVGASIVPRDGGGARKKGSIVRSPVNEARNTARTETVDSKLLGTRHRGELRFSKEWTVTGGNVSFTKAVFH
jgi:hypothetical protein